MEQDYKPVKGLALVIPIKMKNVLDHLAKKPLEWTAFGEIEEIREDGVQYFILKDIAFPKQENSGAATELTGDSYADFGATLHREKKDSSKYRLWIHSHNTMAAFWSGTDTDQMESFITPNTTHRLSLVVSSTHQWRACLNLNKPVRMDFDLGILFNDCVTDQAELDRYKADLESKEVERKYTPSAGKSYRWDYEKNRMVECTFGEERKPELPLPPANASSQEWDEYYDRLHPLDEEPPIILGKKLSKRDKKKAKRVGDILSHLSPAEKGHYNYCVNFYQMTPEEALNEVFKERGSNGGF
jgi:hypothetical protein